MFVFLKAHSVFELLRSYLNLANVDPLPSLRVFEKTNIGCFYLQFGKSIFEPNYTTGANMLHICHSSGILNMN